MLFYQIGELFQSYAVGKSRKNISELMDIRPDYANIEVDGKLTQVDPDEVAIGSVIVVQPGEKVPIDGVIVEGSSTLNTSALTGESVPRDAKCGDEIISGCINMSGVLRLKPPKSLENQRFQRYLTSLKIQAQRNQNQKTSYQNLPSITLRQSATVHLHLRYCHRLSEYFSCQPHRSGAYGYTGHLPSL